MVEGSRGSSTYQSTNLLILSTLYEPLSKQLISVLAGIVVNDSILLVEYVKLRSREGLAMHAAATQAVRDRFRAVFLTSITTVAGMFPLLSETSLQAQVLVPLVASVVFGIIAATGLTLMVLPAAYAILEDLGFVEINEVESSTANGVLKQLS